MVMRCLEIIHLRNLISVRLNLHPHFNYLLGPNGAGKTSVLEAAHLLARCRSFRGSAIGPVINQEQDAVVVRATLEDGRTLGLSKERSGKTVLHIDQQPVHKLSASAALLPMQLLLPNVSDLVFGPPAERRRYLDWGLFHVKHSYLAALKDFQAASRQRNAVLKSWGEQNSEHLLDIWTNAYCRCAAKVSEYRSQYMEELKPCIEAALQALQVEFVLQVEYRNGWGEKPLEKLLGESLAKDVKLGTTQAGPHRAEVSLIVPSGSARTTLSRGQGKLIATALILAQARLLHRQTQRRSLFLIDELGAEMDGVQLSRMLALLDSETCQVIATSTQPPGPEFKTAGDGGEMKLFHVEQGRVQAAVKNEEL